LKGRTIKVLDLKNIFTSTNISRFVDLAEYATIHSIAEGFEPQSDFMVGHFDEDNSESIRILH
jgi:hypothetical protein